MRFWSSKPKMRQWTTAQNGLDKIQLEQAEVPSPKDGEVLVKIYAVSLNYRDTEVCNGSYGHHKSLGPPAPLVPCSDMCGMVEESKSPRFKKGDRVVSIFNQTHLTGQIQEEDMKSGLGFPLPGVLTEYRCFPGDGLVAPPSHLSDEEASTLPIASVTAWMSINSFQPLGQPVDYTASTGDSTGVKPSLLVQGTGGVSVAGLQIARAAGFRTIVTSSSDDKLKRAERDLGAHATVNYRTHWEWQDVVLEATGGRGASVIFETGGARTLRKSFDCVAFGGLISCIGYLSGKGEDDKEPELNRLNVNVLALRRNVTLKGILNGPRDRFEEMIEFYKQKQIKPVVSKVFKFDEAKEAFQYLAEGGHFGKVVIKVADRG